MASSKETFKTLLKDAGYSVTQARIAVFTALLNYQQPLSMGQLVAAAAPVDRASVYRAVALFELLGIVQRIATGWKYRLELSDRFLEHHHHLTCIACGQITSINERELEQFIDDAAKQVHFTPTVHQVEIQGYCSKCTQSAISSDSRMRTTDSSGR